MYLQPAGPRCCGASVMCGRFDELEMMNEAVFPSLGIAPRRSRHTYVSTSIDGHRPGVVSCRSWAIDTTFSIHTYYYVLVMYV